MSEAVASGHPLEVSVSFGKYENDLLSWEKWSSFSANKYLEEVEKCSTPGSVAQKKAYFEAHYKKIAARKADQSDLDRSRSDEPAQESRVRMLPVLENGVFASHVCRSEAGIVSLDHGTPQVNFGPSNEHETVLAEEEEEEEEEEAPSEENSEIRNGDEIVLAQEVAEDEEVTPPQKNLEARRGDEIVAVHEEEEGSCKKNPEIRNGNEVVAVEDDEEEAPKKTPEIINGDEVVTLQVEEEKEEETPQKNPEIRNGDEVVAVQNEEEEETPQKNPEVRKERDEAVAVQEEEEIHPDSLVEEEATRKKPKEVVEQKVVKVDNNGSKLKGHKKRNDHKIHPSMNDQTPMGTRKTLASPAVKSSRVSAPRLPSPELSSSKFLGKKPSGSPLQRIIKNSPMTETKKPSSKLVSTQSSTKIQNGSPLLRSKNSPSPITDNRRAKMSSMHMSLSLGPTVPESTLRKSVVLESVKEKSHFAMRGSLIMDKMGDKEIVRRAFKSFRNSFNDVKCSGDERCSGSEQVTPTKLDTKISPSIAGGEHERFVKLDEKDTPQKGQPVTKSKCVPSRATPKDASVERKKTILPKPSFGLRNRKINDMLEKEGGKPRTIGLSTR